MERGSDNYDGSNRFLGSKIIQLRDPDSRLDVHGDPSDRRES